MAAPPPPVGTGIDRRHPSSRGLIMACYANAGGMFDAVKQLGGTSARFLSGGAATIGRQGRTRSHTATTDYVNLADDASAVVPTSGGTTVLAIFAKRDTTNRNSALFSINENNVNIFRAIVPYSDGTVYFDYGGTTSGSTRLLATGQSWTAGIASVWGFSTGAGGMAIWRDGTKLASNGANPSRTASNAEFRLGSSAFNPSDLIDVSLFLMWKRQLDPVEIKALSNNPWALFASPRRRANILLVDSAAALAPDNVQHDQTADVAAISAESALAPDGAVQTQSVLDAALGFDSPLAPAGALQDQSAEPASLTFLPVIVPTGAVQDQVADPAVAYTNSALAPADAGQAHSAGSAFLSANSPLDPASALQGQSADAAALGFAPLLDPASGVAGQESGEPVVMTASPLSAADGSLDQTAGAPQLAAGSSIGPDGAVQMQTVETPVLTPAAALAPADAVQSSDADAAAVIPNVALTPADAAQSQAASEATLAVQILLAAASCVSGHTAEQALIVFTPPPSPRVPPGGRLVTARQREMLDLLIWRETGGAVPIEAVLAANPGLAALALALPEGKAVALPPPSATAAPATDIVKLWD